MKEILKGLRGCWFWFWGHILAMFFYDKKYLTGRWFNGRMKGLCAIGWEWVTHDALGRIFFHDNKGARFPISQKCRVIFPNNIEFDPHDLNNFQSFGIYYQGIGKIQIGKGTYIAPNVGLITSNHDPNNPKAHLTPKDIHIGKECWIGMNSIVLPGVTLGDKTVVGAGSVVTKSFPEGNCIIAGNPAKVLRLIEEREK